MQLDAGHDPRLDPTLQEKNTKDVTKSTDREHGQVVDWYHRFAEVDHCAVIVCERVLFLTRCILTRLGDQNVHSLLANGSERYIYTYIGERKSEK